MGLSLIFLPCAARPARRSAQLTDRFLYGRLVVDGSLDALTPTFWFDRARRNPRPWLRCSPPPRGPNYRKSDAPRRVRSRGSAVIIRRKSPLPLTRVSPRLSRTANGQEESLAKRKLSVSERLLMGEAATHGPLLNDGRSAVPAVRNSQDPQSDCLSGATGSKVRSSLSTLSPFASAAPIHDHGLTQPNAGNCGHRESSRPAPPPR